MMRRTMLTTYKLRAECPQDIARLISLLASARLFEGLSVEMDPEHPDATMTVSSPLDLAKLRAIIATVRDGHVMLETVAPLVEYTGARDRLARATTGRLLPTTNGQA